MLNLFLTVLAILTVTVGVQQLLRYHALRQFSASHGCRDPPREGPYDYLGIIKIITSTRHLVKRTTLASTVDLFEKYGETYVSRFLAWTVFFTCNPRNIKHVLVIRFVDYDISTVRAHLFRPVTENGIFAVNGPEWKIARDLYRNQFSHTCSILDLNMQERHIQSFLRRIPSTGTPFDIQALFLNLTLDLTTAFALGESVDSLSLIQSDEKKRFVEALLFVKKTIAKDEFLGPVHMLLSKRDFHRACRDVHLYVEGVIERVFQKKQQQSNDSAQVEDPKGCNLLHSLTEITEVVELRDGAISILIAGIDSVASLLSTTFWLLARHERVHQKLRASILNSVGQEPPTYDQLKGLSYLRYIFNEGQTLPLIVFSASC